MSTIGSTCKVQLIWWWELEQCRRCWSI